MMNTNAIANEKPTKALDFDPEEAFSKVAAASGRVSILGASMIDNTVSVDHLPGPGETIPSGPIQQFGGGKSANQAVAAAKIGAHAQLFSAIGSDENAKLIMRLLHEAGVDASNIKQTEGASGSTLIAVDGNAENWVITQAGANATIDGEYLDSVLDTLLEGSALGLCMEIPFETDIAAAKAARSSGLKVWLNNSPFTTDIPTALREFCDGLIVNEHEMARMLGRHDERNEDWDAVDWPAVSEEFREYGFAQAIVTLGAQGSVVLNNGEITRIAPVKIRAVDTTGCGDSFFAGILSGLAGGLTLEDSARLASYVSAYAATGMGAQASYGSAEQILELTR